MEPGRKDLCSIGSRLTIQLASYNKNHIHTNIYKIEPTTTCCIAQGTQLCVITYRGKASEKEYVYITGLLCYIHLKLQDNKSTINQLYFNFKK